MKTATNHSTPLSRALADELFERYDAWRRESTAVQRAYDAWVAAERANRELTYAGYLAALDQESVAADAYRDQIARARTLSGGPRP